MKKFLLGALLANQKLHVVDQDHVILAVPVAEVVHLIVAQRTHQIIEELFRRDVARQHVAVRLLHVVANGMQQVRLP